MGAPFYGGFMKSITKLIIAVPLLIFGIPTLHILIATAIPKNPLVVMNGKEFLIPAELRDYVGYGGGDSILFHLDGETLEVATKFEDSPEGRRKVIRVRASPYETETAPKNVQAAYKKMFREHIAAWCKPYISNARKHQICYYMPNSQDRGHVYLMSQGEEIISRGSCTDASVNLPNPICRLRMVIYGDISVSVSFSIVYESKISEVDSTVRQHFDRFHQEAQLLKQGNK